MFIRPQLIGNSVDAQGVTEEFRQRLGAMRNTGTLVRGRNQPVIIGKY